MQFVNKSWYNMLSGVPPPPEKKRSLESVKVLNVYSEKKSMDNIQFFKSKKGI